jgi:hypothetical protein
MDLPWRRLFHREGMWLCVVARPDMGMDKHERATPPACDSGDGDSVVSGVAS